MPSAADSHEHLQTGGSADAVFAALADPTRRNILARLVDEGGLTATTLGAELGITRQGVAKHVDILAASGLVTRERLGRETRLHADTSPFTGVVEHLVAIAGVAWDERLRRLGALLGSNGDS